MSPPGGRRPHGRETGCDAVMIGRMASSNPWIFRQIDEYLARDRNSVQAEHQRYDMMKTYYACSKNRRARCGRQDEAVRDLLHPWGSQWIEAARGHLPAHEVKQVLEVVDAFFCEQLQHAEVA